MCSFLVGDDNAAGISQFRFVCFPKIVTIIYWIGLVLIALGTLLGFLGALFMGSSGYGSAMGAGGGIIGALLTLAGGVIGIVAWRLVVEFWLVIFSIRDLLRDIRDGQNRT